MSTPLEAPRPIPTMMAVGVARPSAHGHAMTSTATVIISAFITAGSGARNDHTAKTTTATIRTTGTKSAVTLSTRCSIGARDDCACWTILTIPANIVSRPTAEATNWTAPVPLTVPVNRPSPGCFSTGTGSPVSIDSSMAVVPSEISPSTGTRSPGRRTITLPGSTSAISTSTGEPSLITIAFDG